jgi:hypothetical protein
VSFMTHLTTPIVCNSQHLSDDDGGRFVSCDSSFAAGGRRHVTAKTTVVMPMPMRTPNDTAAAMVVLAKRPTPSLPMFGSIGVDGTTTSGPS